MKVRVGIFSLLLTLSLGSSPVFGAPPTVGVACTKAGLVSGFLVCQKVKGKLLWQVYKKAQTITFSAPIQGSISDKYLKISYASTSRLTVTARSVTPNVCSIANSTVGKIALLTGQVGLCSISLSQSGNANYLPAKTASLKIPIFGLNTVTFTMPATFLLSQGTYTLIATSSSGLPILLTSTTTDVCTIQDSILTLVAVGTCSVVASQAGAGYIPAAVPVRQSAEISLAPNTISFQLPGALLLTLGSYNLTASSTSNLPITYTTTTPEVCSVANATLTLLKAGSCTVTASQNASQFVAAPIPVTQTVEISLSRVTADLPDLVRGFQIKAIYVVPSDGVDNLSDTNGYLASVLDEGNRYLKSQLNLTLPIDRTTNGYDIQFLRSKYSTEYLRTHANATPKATSDSYVLLDEIKAMENPGDNRKDYIFFIEVPGFEGPYCGMADRPGISAIVALKNISADVVCTGKSSSNFNDYASRTWVHETFHNFGVSHTVDDPCDLMAGTPETKGTCNSTTRDTLDKERTRYVGASVQGQDILKLRVWEGYTDNANLRADCVTDPITRLDGLHYAYCPTGTRVIGAFQKCWSAIYSLSLEEEVGGIWKSLGDASHYSEVWGGAFPGWKCTSGTIPWKEITVDTPGVRHYRWIVNSTVAEEMNIIWVR